MLTLFGSSGSGSAAVELALARCGVPYRVQRASTWEADSPQADLQRANPLGQIPALALEDGSVLTASAAILIHLGLAHPGAVLLPQDPFARAQAVRGLVFIATKCYAAIGVIDYPERWSESGDDATLAGIRAGTRARLHRFWEIFADQFEPVLWRGEGRPAALDFLAAVVSRWGGARAHLRATRPTALARLEAIEAHAEAAPAFARHWPAEPVKSASLSGAN